MFIYNNQTKHYQSININNCIGLLHNITYFIVSGECPQTYPFAFNGGQHCCPYDKEWEGKYLGITPGRDPVWDMGCDGGPISLSSKCCPYGENSRCPENPGNKRCRNRGNYKN